jgi:hypothetical protein
MNFTSQPLYTHKITHGFTPGSLDSCTQTPRTKQSITNMPLPSLDGVRRSCLRRSASGEVRGGDGPVPHDLQRLLIMMGGDVLEGH